MKEEIVAVLRGAAANKEGELCVQAIFLLLDVLKKWAEDAKGTAAFSASGMILFRSLHAALFCQRSAV